MSKRFFLTVPILCVATLTGCGGSTNASEDYGLATTPVVNSKNNTVIYGLYPQKRVGDSKLISSLEALTAPESNGWYLYNENYYAKESAKLYNSAYKFDDGTAIVEGTTYWFKCEPIVWNILSNDNGEYFLRSSVLLDAHRFNEAWVGLKSDKCANNYEYSEVRSWLNNEFYNSAFALGNECIQTTTVDNSASTTKREDTVGGYTCENTNDKVFLLSYQDYINSSYGFSTGTSSSNTRTCKTTDYARARGAYCFVQFDYSYKYCSHYWTRSPYSDGGAHVWFVGSEGNINRSGNGVDSTDYCVNPAIKIKIN